MQGTELFRSYEDKFSVFAHLMECVFRFQTGPDGNCYSSIQRGGHSPSQYAYLSSSQRTLPSYTITSKNCESFARLSWSRKQLTLTESKSSVNFVALQVLSELCSRCNQNTCSSSGKKCPLFLTHLSDVT
jgi:hypothetical protein